MNQGLVFLFVILICLGCKKNNSSTNSGNSNASIIGKWAIVEIVFNNSGGSSGSESWQNYDSFNIILYKDYRYQFNFPENNSWGTNTGTYQILQDSLIVFSSYSEILMNYLYAWQFPLSSAAFALSGDTAYFRNSTQNNLLIYVKSVYQSSIDIDTTYYQRLQ
jgi:hypothetical protein